MPNNSHPATHLTIRVSNPSLDEPIVFNIKYDSVKEQHCEVKLLGHVYEDASRLEKGRCFSYQVDKRAILPLKTEAIPLY